jgi:hypothetical protein
MDNSALPQGLDRVLPSRRRRRHGQKAYENLGSFYATNPLISLDSDEEIQGNPRKSNPLNLGFQKLNSHRPRKPKRVVLTHVAGPPPGGSQTDSIRK